MRWQIVAFLGLFFVGMAANAHADSGYTGKINAQTDQPIILEYLNDDNIRMSMGDDGFVLLSSGKLYLGFKDGDDWDVQSAEEMAGILKASGLSGILSKMKDEPTEAQGEIRATGKKEEIAGYTGEVYEIESTYQGKTEQTTIVLSDHPDVVKLTEAYVTLATKGLELIDNPQARQTLDQIKSANADKPQGLLRSGNDIRLESITAGPIELSRFDITRYGAAAPAATDNAATPAPTTKSTDTSASSDNTGDKKADKKEGSNELEKSSERVAKRAQGQTEKSIGDEIGKVISDTTSKIFKNVFGD